MPKRFETLRIGVMSAGDDPVFDVRLIREAGGAYHVTTGSALGEPHATEADAVAAVEGHQANAEIRVAWRADLAVGERERPCPTCGAPLDLGGGSRDAVCPPCAAEAVDAAGRALRFTNDTVGLEAAAYEDGTPYAGTTCWVRGVRCRARAGRFGGVAVAPEGGE